LITAMLVGCAASQKDEAKRCTELRDHLVDLRLAQSEGAKDALGNPIDLEPHRAALKQAMGADFVTQCQKEFTHAQIKCVLAANDSPSATACTSSRSSSASK